jgi:inner membrane protein involved in colicin E2 resistance
VTASRLGIVIVIFVMVSCAWAILSGAMYTRTTRSANALRPRVEGLWGGPLKQRAPTARAMWTETTREWDEKRDRRVEVKRTQTRDLTLSSSTIEVDLRADFRRKGLLWYRTYDVEFDGQYEVANSFQRPVNVEVSFAFPGQGTTYDAFEFAVGEKKAEPVGDTKQGMSVTVFAKPGAKVPVKVHYKTRGLDTWSYTFGDGTTRVKDCTLTVRADFARIDFPDQTVSPTSKTRQGPGWELKWKFASLVTGMGIAVDMPEKLDPGPWATRVSAFAPIGLFFFLAVLIIVGVLKSRNLHPMHYMFVCAAFFSFHLLLAYLVDHMDAHAAFAIAAACSVLLVVTYVIRVTGARFAFSVVALAQLVFLVLFSYSFFYPGYTGLAITIGAVLTLAVLMHLTAGVNWDERLGPPGTKDYPPTPGIALPSRLARARGRDLNHHPLPHEDEGAGHTEV